MTIQEQFSLKTEKHPTEVTVNGVIPANLIQEQRQKAIENLKKELSFDGFREGGATDHMVIQKVGELAVWTRAGVEVVQAHIAEILGTTGTIPIDQPRVSIKDTALNGIISFDIQVQRYPDITLPDYSAIARKEGPLTPVQVTDQEVEDALLQLRKDVFTAEHKDQTPPETLPPLTDEQVQKLNPKYRTAIEFIENFKHTFINNKEYEQRAQRRARFVEHVVKNMQVEIPDIFINREVEALVEGVRNDAKRLNTTLESFLKQHNKDLEILKKEMRAAADKRVRIQLALNEIAKREKLQSEEKQVEVEIKRIQAREPTLSEHDVHTIAVSILMNEEVFRFLENIADIAPVQSV